MSAGIGIPAGGIVDGGAGVKLTFTESTDYTQGSNSSETVTISIPPEELNRTRSLAAKRGLRYQTYLKMLLHEALDAEEKSSLVDFGVCPDAQRVSAISQAS